MADSFGSLVDKLSIVNIKLYMVQDKVHEAAATGQALDVETTQQLVLLNQQRNALMREIDQLLHESVSTGKVIVDPRVKLV